MKLNSALGNDAITSQSQRTIGGDSEIASTVETLFHLISRPQHALDHRRKRVRRTQISVAVIEIAPKPAISKAGELRTREKASSVSHGNPH